MKGIFVVLAFLLLSPAAGAHPGIGGCKDAVLGDVTYTTDCAVQLNANSVGAAEIADFVDGDVFNLGSVIPDSTADDGLILPGTPATCIGASHEGQVCWNRGSDVLSIGTGTAAKIIGENVANVGDCNGPDCFTGSATTEGTLLRFGLTANVATQGNIRFDVNGRVCWKFTPELCIYMVSPGQFAFENGWLYMANYWPQVVFDDSDQSDGSPEASISANSAGTDNGNLQLMVESGAPNAVGLLSILTTGGVSTVYLGGNAAADTVPTNAVRVSEAGVMSTRGAGQIRNADPRCIELTASDGACASFGCTAAQVTPASSHYAYRTLNFPHDDSTDRSAVWTFQIPPGWDEGAPDPTLFVTINAVSDHANCTSLASTAKDICFEFNTGSAFAGEAIVAPTLGGTWNFSSAVCQGNGNLTEFSRSGFVHGTFDGGFGIFRLVRPGLAVAGNCAGLDDYPQDIKVMSVRLCKQ